MPRNQHGRCIECGRVISTGDALPMRDPDGAPVEAYLCDLHRGQAPSARTLASLEVHRRICCVRCGLTSYHPEDRRTGWCGCCQDYTQPGSDSTRRRTTPGVEHA